MIRTVHQEHNAINSWQIVFPHSASYREDVNEKQWKLSQNLEQCTSVIRKQHFFFKVLAYTASLQDAISCFTKLVIIDQNYQSL